ncbi:hypothetical protein CFD26_103731 [Aspergillus turcosus]|uniref:Uncharacterized protein n=1 Tax=Aspergillus turcosus TaxID=1245748 RepID=A0A421D5V0_9EURO|nr:hypothetical protein CFD26_103731 [Aspergillus turcosus]
MMEGPIANVSKLKPEIRLVQALADFKAVLSADRRPRFDESIASFQDRPPDANDVNRLAAEINRDIQKTTRRCYGPRFVRVLQAVQQYASMGDIFIGGSQNLIASGVWAAMLTQSASYLERMSTLFMNAGRGAPRYEDMALLYPPSKRLRDALCEYFIVILNICKHAVKFLQKSPLSQFSSAISNSSLASFEKELQQWSIAIVEEFALLSSQTLQEEAKENSRFRRIMVKLSDSSNQRQQLALRLRLLDACSTYDYQTSWKQARKQGTTSWFASTTEYQKWKEASSSCSLLCTGKLGSGKTTLMATMVDDLFCSAPKGTTAYFFCRFDVSESLTARTIIGCLARQLLGQQPIYLTTIDNLFESWLARPDEQGILTFLRELLPAAPIYSLVVDGLDECPIRERQATFKILQQLQEHLNVCLCLSFRKDAEDHANTAAGILNGKWTLPIPESNPDIEAYIDAELCERLESDRLSVGDPAIILSIQRALVTGAQGMFLWATLLLDCVCMEQTDEAILQALESLPQSLSETFTRVLQQAGASNMRHRRRIVQLVMAARRPLLVEELCEALSVIPGDTTWETARQINNIHAALASCKCLMIIDEEEQTVRFAHHSVKQFFIAQGDDPGNTNPINPDEANKEMGRIILTYLNYGIFDWQVSRAVLPSIPAEDAPARIVSTVFGGSASTKRIALRLLKTRNNYECDIGQTLAKRAMEQQQSPVENHSFVAYAKEYFKYHILGVWDSDERMAQLWQCALDNESFALRITGWLQYELQQRRVTGLHGNFVPSDVLHQLLEYDIVRRVLEETGYDEQSTSAAAHIILNDCLRSFAILVDIGFLDPIRQAHCIKDCDLPISRVHFLELLKPKVPKATVDTAQLVSKSFRSMKMDRWWKLAKLFCVRQRGYLVPILQAGQHYDAAEEVMPFLPIGNTTCSNDQPLLVLIHPAHQVFPRPYRDVDGGYQFELRSLQHGIDSANQFLIYPGRSKVDPFHLLQAVASYRPPEQGETPQPIRLIFPISGANLDDLWCQRAVTHSVEWCLKQMTGLAEALAFVIRKDPGQRYISLRQITPYDIQYTNGRSRGSQSLHLDLGTLMVDPSKRPLCHLAYRAPDEDDILDLLYECHGVWSLGCLYLEFLIWAVRGPTDLQRFREAKGGANAPFYSVTSSDDGQYDEIRLAPEVRRWAKKLRKGSELRTVRRLIEYLLGNVLVVNPGARVSASKLASDLEELRAKSEALEPAYHIQKFHEAV